MRTLSVLLLTAAILLSAGCEGEQGPVGPSGADGNANILTGTISPTNEDWLWFEYYTFRASSVLTASYYTRYVNIPVAEITPGIISAGAVLVTFESDPGSGNWTPLPFQFVGMDHDYMHNIVYEVMEGNIRLHFFNAPTSSGATVPNPETHILPTYTFKYTVIEGNVLETMMARGVDVSDHGQVIDYLAP